MRNDQLRDLIIRALDDLKAQNITVLDLPPDAAFTDFMIIATGTSDRHVKALADSVVTKAKAAGVMPLGVEGERGADWILVDLADVVVHLMQARTRDFYQLERLWGFEAPSAPRAALSG